MKDKTRLNKNEDLDSIISKMMKAWGMEKKMKEMDVINAWEELMGKGVAYRTESVSIRNKILHLKINSSVMRDELAFGKDVIIQRVNQFAGQQLVNDVWFS